MFRISSLRNHFTSPHLIRQIRNLSTPAPAKLILYTDDSCPPCIAVQMTAKHVGINFEKRHLNLVGWDHLKLDFLKVNPLHSVPTLVDDGNIFWDSHAIMPYLVTKYGSGEAKSLYPDDLVLRTKIQQCLYFDTGMLFSRLRFLGVSFST